MISIIFKKIFTYLLFVLVLLLYACGGSSGTATPPPSDDGNTNTPEPFDGASPTGKATLSGIIKQSNGASLAGATITIKNSTKTAITDASGVFVIPEMATGNYVIIINGSTGSGGAGTMYGTLNIPVTVGPTSDANLEQVIILPNLNSSSTAADTVTAIAGNVPSIAANTGDVTLTSNGGAVTVQLAGVNADGSVKISATPVPLTDLPMTLPKSAGSNAANFVTIHPTNATFSPALDLTIPNDQNLPVGTLVDIYSFDHDLGAWVNRSAESSPKNQGVVVAGGQTIVATGIIAKGGWHGPLVIADYTESVIGTVTDGTRPLEGAFVFTNTGQLGVTDASGNFSINVPIFGTDAAPPITISVTSPVSLGGISTTPAVMNAANDTTSLDFGTITLAIPSTGTLSGTSLKAGVPSTATITLSGTSSATITPNTDGSFFLSGLATGSYALSTTFSGDTTATTATFTIVSGKITIVLLEKNTGNNVAVKVFLLPGSNLSSAVLADAASNKATVTLSQDGAATVVTQDTNTDGVAIFSNITGPFIVTGQYDFTTAAGTQRSAMSIHNINPPSGQVGLPIFASNSRKNIFFPPQFIQSVAGTTIDGTLMNLPVIPATHELVVKADPIGENICCNAESMVLMGTGVAPPDVGFSISNNLGEAQYSVYAEVRQNQEVVLNGPPRSKTITTNYHSAAVYTSSVTTTGGATSAGINISFTNPAMKVDFIDKSIEVNNFIENAANDEIGISSTLILPFGGKIYFKTYFQEKFEGMGVNPPATGAIGSFVSAILTGSTVAFSLELYTPRRVVDVTFTTASNLTFDLTGSTIAAPMILTPTAAQVFSVLNIGNMSSSWIPGVTNTDLVFVDISGGTSAIANVDKIYWENLLVGDSVNMTIPPVAPTLPMFGPGSQYDIEVGYEIFNRTFDFNFFFNFDVISNIGSVYNSDSIDEASSQISIETSL